MNVLWFSNTPALANDYLKQNIIWGGWLYSLNKAIQEKVELSVAFECTNKLSPFKFQNTQFFPIYTPKNIKNKIIHSLRNKLFDKKNSLKYFEIIKTVNPDIIHIHGSENPFGYILGKVKIPTVISIQGIITVYAYKYFSGIERKYLRTNSYSLKNLLLPKSFKKNYSRFLELRAQEIEYLKNAKFVIGRTDWDYRVTRVLAPNSIYFKNDEILRPAFYSKEDDKRSKDNTIIHTTTGNNFYKGFEVVCLTLNELNNLGYNLQWRITGISNNDLIVKIVQKKLGKLFPQKGLYLLGQQNSEELKKCLLEATLYVMPSHIENSPNNLCEAMILGLPCIASFAGGTGSLMNNGEEGILVQDGDPWALTGAIIELINDAEKQKLYGNNARLKAMKRHDIDSITNNLLNIYKKIIEQSIL